MGNVTPPMSFPPSSADTSSLNTQSTFTPSSPDKPSTASSEDHSASNAIVARKNKQKTTTKVNISDLISGSKLILKSPLKIDVIVQLTSNKNNIDVVNLSSTDFDHSHVALRQRHQR